MYIKQFISCLKIVYYFYDYKCFLYFLRNCQKKQVKNTVHNCNSSQGLRIKFFLQSSIVSVERGVTLQYTYIMSLVNILAHNFFIYDKTASNFATIICMGIRTTSQEFQLIFCKSISINTP
jgi:hypothetical protein